VEEEEVNKTEVDYLEVLEVEDQVVVAQENLALEQQGKETTEAAVIIRQELQEISVPLMLLLAAVPDRLAAAAHL
jgi:uncharacterized Zn finger protein